MDPLRFYLLTGLVVHKTVWEVLKRRLRGDPSVKPTGGASRTFLLKLLKTLILAGVVAQTLLPDVLPIQNSPRFLPIVGIALYTTGLLIAVVARIQLGSNWSDIESPEVGRGHALVSNGIYRYVRHPIYTGDLALLLGLELALNSWLVAAALLLTPFVLVQAIREERTLRVLLPGYEGYCARTRRFIPFVV
jgi:protein-S-isoprenylcysteine O-methyltransferase Ste14